MHYLSIFFHFHEIRIYAKQALMNQCSWINALDSCFRRVGVKKKLIFQYRTLSLQFFFIASFFWHQLIQNTTKIRRIQTTWECCLISILWQVIFCLPVLYNSFCPKLHGLSFQQNDYLTVIKEKFTYVIDIIV